MDTRGIRATLFSRIFFSHYWLSTANLCSSLLIAKSLSALFKNHLLLIVTRSRWIHFGAFGPYGMTHVKKENKANRFFNNTVLSGNSFRAKAA